MLRIDDPASEAWSLSFVTARFVLERVRYHLLDELLLLQTQTTYTCRHVRDDVRDEEARDKHEMLRKAIENISSIKFKPIDCLTSNMMTKASLAVKIK